MKTKLFKVLGVALPIMMVLAMAVMLIPAQAPTAEAAVGTLRFETVPLPKIGVTGDYVIAPDTNLGPLAVAPGGAVLYCTADITDTAVVSTLLKSSNGGNTWKVQTAFRTTATANTDNTSVVAIGLSPEYGTDNTIFVATEKYVYQSVDGGKNFSAMNQPSTWDTDETITDMAVAMDSTGRASVILGSAETTDDGNVYVYSPATTGLGWQAQTILGGDVLAVAFSPNFADDEGIVAVTVNGTDTKIQFAFGYTQTGGGWGTSVGPGKFLNTSGVAIVNTSRARIAFPDDFDVDSTLSNICWVGLVAGTAGSTTEYGDVYQVTAQPTASSTEDVNVRGLVSTVRTGTNIWSLDVTGDAAAATILVGTNFWSTGVANYYWTAYISKDSGATWSTAREKSPTGGALGAATTMLSGVKCEVVLGPNFATDGIAFAATQGTDTSAISRTSNSGASWNQVSLIDWADATNGYVVINQHANLIDNNDQMVILHSAPWGANPIGLIQGTNASIFHTINGGGTWERILSYANPGLPVSLDGVYRLLPVSTVFAIDKISGKFWRSTDGGATFPRIITAKTGNISSWRITDADTIFTTHFWDGAVWYTENAGRPWVKPDETDTSLFPLMSTQQGDKILVGDMVGSIHISLDAGVNFKRLGVNNPTGTSGLCTFDPNYATNHFVYASGAGVWRIEVNEDDVQSTEWKRIDAPTATLNTNANSVSPSVMLYLGSILYVVDGANVSATSGGLWRCTNPAADLDGTSPPAWETVNTGLEAFFASAGDDKMGYSGLGVVPYTFFLKNSNTAVAFTNRLMAYADTMSSAVKLIAPSNDAKGVGVALSTTSLVKTVVITWEALGGVTSYQYQVANDEDFKSLVTNAAGSTPGQQFSASDLIPGQTYYWRIRSDEPVTTPWSETRAFTVAGVETPFDLVSPVRGATDIDVMPVFIWNVFEGATGYEVVVSEDPTFAIIDWSRSTTQTMYKAEEGLAYNTTYYWRVRGVTGPAPAQQAAPGGPWATGIFTTGAKAVAPTPPVVTPPTQPTSPPEIKVVEVPIPGPAQAIPDYLLWIVIVVGAVLVIALIVLIVRTRRVA